MRIPPPAGANRLARYFECIRPTSRRQFPKVFRGVKRGFFQKAPSCASPLRHFLFASFSFVPPCSKEKEELWNLMTEWEKYLCVRAGGYGILPYGVGCDNRMNFPTLQNILCFACSPTRSRGSPLPEGAFCLCEHCGDAPCFSAGTTVGRPRTYKDQIP